MVDIPARPGNVESLPSHKDTGLLPDENPNLKEEIQSSIGDDWLHARNTWLGGRAPDELLGTPDEFHVRALLRSIKVVALT